MRHRTFLLAALLASIALAGCIVEPAETDEEPIDSTESALIAAPQQPPGTGDTVSSGVVKTGTRATDQVGTGVGDVMNGSDPANPKPQPDPWGDPSAPTTNTAGTAK